MVNDTGDAGDFSAGDGVCETGSGNGLCTLRAAIEEANASTALDSIEFSIPTSDSGYTGQWWVIGLSSALPTLTDDGIEIRGLTQASNQGDTNPGVVGTGGTVGVDGEPLPQYTRPEIAIDGNGFDVYAVGGAVSNVLIEGSAIYDGNLGFSP